MAQGRFITFEGGEGTGKSTQARRLAERLRSRGLEVVVTREPGGTAEAEAVRSLLVNGEADRWSPLAETLLLNAARDHHLRTLIRPALARGACVISDRFADSTRAYQGVAGDLGADLVLRLEEAVVAETRPDLTLVLDAPADLGLARAAARRGGEGRFESKSLTFHERLRTAYADLLAAEPERCVGIDATGDEDAVEAAVAAAVESRFGPLL